MSGNDHDILLEADAITEELLELLINDYKEHDGFNLNAQHE